MKLHKILLASLVLLSPIAAKAQTEAAAVSRDSVMAVINAAKDSDPEALNNLGVWYYNGENVERDYTTAARMFAKAASLGNVEAIANLGLCYRYGNGVEQDSVRAMGLYERSLREGNTTLLAELKADADKGDIFACAAAAHFFNNGIGTARDYAQAANYYSRLARKDKNNTTAVRQAGVAYLNAKDYKKALEWLRKGALAGDTVCEYYYGSMLVEGLGGTQDFATGFVYAMNAAEDGNANAMYLVARLYREGKGVNVSTTQANEWLAKAAYLGLPKAIYDYALVAVEKNEILEAAYLFSWLQARNSFVQQVKALFDEKNDNNILSTPFGHYTLAISAIAAGDFKTAKNEIKALKKAKIALADVLEAQILLSPANEKRDVAKAVKQLTKIAGKNAYAAYTLGLIYERGAENLEPDPEKALEYLTMAADADFILAGDALGNAYYEGSFGARDSALARKAYEAQNARGIMLATAASRYASSIQDTDAALAKKVASMKYPESLDSYLAITK